MTDHRLRLLRWPLCLVAALSLGAGPCGGTRTDFPDANDDGVVNVLDAALVSSCIPTADVSSHPSCSAADTDRDGDVDLEDADVVRAHFGIRVRLQGDLFAVGAGQITPFARVGSQLGVPLPASGGTFVWNSTSPTSDLRQTPGDLSWNRPTGSLTAKLVRKNSMPRISFDTGRPLRVDAPEFASCSTGAEPACWAPGLPEVSRKSFDALCVDSFLFDSSKCLLTAMQSSVVPLARGGLAPLPFSALFTSISAGENQGFLQGNLLLSALGGYTQQTWLEFYQNALYRQADYTSFPQLVRAPTLLVPLVVDVRDGPPTVFADLPLPVQQVLGAGSGGAVATAFLANSASTYLTEEQESLFGCGPFYGTNCDADGFDLFRSEASAVFGAIPGLSPLRCGRGFPAAPGSSGGGDWLILPGCRGPGQPAYDPIIDGTIPLIPSRPRALHPFTGIPFDAEISVASWNLAQAFASLSPDFQPDTPFPATGCNLSNPESCAWVEALLSNTGRALPGELETGPDGSIGPELRWLWQMGAEYVVTSATGDLATYLGYELHALGPEQPRVPSHEAGVAFILRAPAGAGLPTLTPFLLRYSGLDQALGTPDDRFRGAAYGLVP